MTADPELIDIFLEESRENLDQVDLDLVALEADPTNDQLLDRVFRALHTIKGTCGFLGFYHMGSLAHSGEDLLAALRGGQLSLNAPTVTALLHLVDGLRNAMDFVAQQGTEPAEVPVTLVSELASLVPTARTPIEGPTGQAPPPSSAPASSAPPTAPGPAVPPEPATPPEPAQRPEEPAGASPHGNASSVRVAVQVLDRLSELVGELTLTKLALARLTDVQQGPAAPSFHQLELLTAQLQEAVTLARLEPVGTVTAKMRRLGRDLATELAKSVRVELTGVEIGVDRAINEALRDPLTHLVRNALDHGIESAAERATTGKPAQATLRIDASVASGRILVRVSDDGRGIDVPALVDRALQAGHLTTGQVATMSREEQLALVFLPGVSTAAKVTGLSGRGVGMDVVWSNLERIGGTVAIASEPGHGTTFDISLPMTLAIIPALILRAAGHLLAVPQVDVERVVRLDHDADTEAQDRGAQVHEVAGRHMLRHQGELLPLIGAAEALGAAPRSPGRHAGAARPTGEVVIISRPDLSYGLLVDEVTDITEAVVRPLPEALAGALTYTGVTLLADGAPALILDAAALPAAAGLPRPSRAGARAPAIPAQDTPQATIPMLLTSLPDGRNLALPAQRLQRIEAITEAEIQWLGDREVLVRADQVMPLQRVAARGAATRAAIFGAADGPGVAVALGDALDIMVIAEAQLAPHGTCGLRPAVHLGSEVAELVDPFAAQGWGG